MIVALSRDSVLGGNAPLPTPYLALVHELPLVLQWNEQIAEDEHLVFRKVRDQVDWS